MNGTRRAARAQGHADKAPHSHHDVCSSRYPCRWCGFLRVPLPRWCKEGRSIFFLDGGLWRQQNWGGTNGSPSYPHFRGTVGATPIDAAAGVRCTRFESLDMWRAIRLGTWDDEAQARQAAECMR